MKQLRIANSLIGDRKALDDAWERDGYWFFKGVLDPVAVDHVRQRFLAELERFALIVPGDSTARYNGASLENLPGRAYGLEILKGENVWFPFTQDSKVREFFSNLLGEDPMWLPIGEYRAVAPLPAEARADDRRAYVHQDSFYNQGIEFRICWIPLTSIDDEVGGMIIAEGLHNGPCLHDMGNPPIFPIPDGAIPEDAWRRADYEPGDLLMMQMSVPHTAINNHSDRFRLSMDIRMVLDQANAPAMGTIEALDTQHITLRDRDGTLKTFVVNESTYCRGGTQDRITVEQMVAQFKIGDPVIVPGKDGVATVIRPQH